MLNDSNQVLAVYRSQIPPEGPKCYVTQNAGDVAILLLSIALIIHKSIIYICTHMNILFEATYAYAYLKLFKHQFMT